MSNLIKFGVAAALAAVTVVAGAAEPAALLQQPQGKVFVSQGSAMVPVREGMAVAAGSRVVSLEGSQVNVTYADGCVLALPANSMLVLGQTRKCAQDLAAIRAVDGFQAERIGQVPQQPRTVAAQIPNAVTGAKVNTKPVVNGMKLFKGDHVLVYRVDRWTRVASDAEGEILRAEFFSPEALPPDVTRSSRERIREVLAGAEASSDW